MRNVRLSTLAPMVINSHISADHARVLQRIVRICAVEAILNHQQPHVSPQGSLRRTRCNALVELAQFKAVLRKANYPTFCHTARHATRAL